MEIVSWNEERMGRLQRLYMEGVSFSLIADDIGVTRCAAIGKARRMKLPKRVEVVLSKRLPAAPRRPPKARARVARVARVDVPELPAVEFIPNHDYCCAINDLTNCSCRYPLWDSSTRHPDRRYCGFPTASVSAGVPYCRRHTIVCDTTAPR